jgi:hypothetical protein
MPYAGADTIKTGRIVKKIEAITQLCQAAISKQVEPVSRERLSSSLAARMRASNSPRRL